MRKLFPIMSLFVLLTVSCSNEKFSDPLSDEAARKVYTDIVKVDSSNDHIKNPKFITSLMGSSGKPVVIAIYEDQEKVEYEDQSEELEAETIPVDYIVKIENKFSGWKITQKEKVTEKHMWMEDTDGDGTRESMLEESYYSTIDSIYFERIDNKDYIYFYTQEILDNGTCCPSDQAIKFHLIDLHNFKRHILTYELFGEEPPMVKTMSPALEGEEGLIGFLERKGENIKIDDYGLLSFNEFAGENHISPVKQVSQQVYSIKDLRQRLIGLDGNDLIDELGEPDMQTFAMGSVIHYRSLYTNIKVEDRDGSVKNGVIVRMKCPLGYGGGKNYYEIVDIKATNQTSL